NYPNPFNPSTTITISLPTQTDFTLTIYDVLGKEVKTFNYEKAAAGTHDVVWDGTNESRQALPSSVYVYRIVAGSFIESKKLTLIK
ncbi:MAG: Por secretion system C-terminal sorting domain-containing protein, partial [Bacteroidetes bacterium]|nr:Por secretion system C-terminal sorting domain-containing protein [Bacteroidota bacterium]